MVTQGRRVTRDNLNDVMEFDHVIRVHEDGSVTDAESALYAPSLYDGDLDDGYQGQRWTLLDGYSGQYSYSGPVMHNAEFIGGRLADDILSTPGAYVAIANGTLEHNEDCGGTDESSDACDGNCNDDAEGWAVARLIED